MAGNDLVDPLFGMTAVKDTRAMDMARYKNKTQQMLLEKQHTRLETEFRHRSTKLDTELCDLQDFYQGIDSKSIRAVICPRGLSDDQKQQYRKMRQRSLPSINLDEFDRRMNDYRRQMKYRRYGIQYVRSTIVDVDHYQFIAPITKTKYTMREALDRATSGTVQLTNKHHAAVGNSKTFPTSIPSFYSTAILHGSKSDGRKRNCIKTDGLKFPPKPDFQGLKTTQHRPTNVEINNKKLHLK